MKTVLLEVESKGCASCTLTVLQHLFKTQGVKGARAIGRLIYVYVEDWVTPEHLLSSSGIEKYYFVRRCELYDGVVEVPQYSLK